MEKFFFFGGGGGGIFFPQDGGNPDSYNPLADNRLIIMS